MRTILELLLISSLLISICYCQLGFESNADKQYFARHQELLSNEVGISKGNVLGHITSMQIATRDYISVKLKENVLTTLQALTANVAEPVTSRRSWKKDLLREPRQDEEPVPEGASESGGGEGGEASATSEEDEEPGTTELTGLGTAVQINENVFKFLGDAVRIIVGGIGGPRARKFKKSEDHYLIAAEALMNERFSDQLLGLIVLIANESESVQQNLPWKTIREDHLSLKKVLLNSVKHTQPVAEQVHLKGDGHNTYYFVETFRRDIDQILLRKYAERAESVPDLYNGVRGSFELLTALEKVAMSLKHH